MSKYIDGIPVTIEETRFASAFNKNIYLGPPEINEPSKELSTFCVRHIKLSFANYVSLSDLFSYQYGDMKVIYTLLFAGA